MKRFAVFALSTTLLLLLSARADEDVLQGFTSQSSAQERDWETKFRAIPNADNQRAYMQRLSARPHHVGSPYDKENAEWILSKYKEWGWDAKIEIFDVLFPTPKERVLEMVEPTKFTAKLQEPVVANDPTSSQQNEQLPSYNAYSIDGDVTAPLVFVNYGLPKDYEELDRLGVSAKGAIVIAKYGNSWRGIKPKVAAEHGAAGCIIYSDPSDDGYDIDNVFPKGPMRPSEGVQRGSVMDFPSNSPGDPLTPGVGATPDAKRLAVKDAPSLTKIPVLPISYGDAQPLLAALAGPMAPKEWRGGLAIPYHVGAGPAKVHLKVSFNWDIKPVYDVIARIPGSQDADAWVIRGNHHDAWVNGAEDPTSGQIALLEEARAFGELVKQGWKPKRTIIYASWDGEEPMLLGSTEWAEAHDKELQQHAVAYINSDGNDRGYLSMNGSHTLEHFMNGVARDIQDPETKLSVLQRLHLRQIERAKNAEDRQEIRQRADARLTALGSGSDYTAFIDHLGIASLDVSFEGEDNGGIYHSIYDDFYWYTHFSDTNFVYARALSQTIGTAVMRLADADVLPFEFTNFADTIHMYSKELKKLADDERDEAIERDKELSEGLYSAVNDPRHSEVAPPNEEIPPHLNFAPLDNVADSLTTSAQRYQQALAKAQVSGLSPATVAELNEKLMESERRLTTQEGLLRREWYKHMIYAPGVYSGYGAKTLPGVREAIEQKHWDEANAEIVRVSKVLENERALVDSASEDLEAPKH
ncbi:MAG TPA: transferrin receptor-like dimerization domain-containing protein [Candidatus Acidoferrales bacterium]|nr:transferrin receptor-like dimerization domain-containing protein [Candidatus Acidoferrales bacterium]